jgi:hypothetical protein
VGGPVAGGAPCAKSSVAGAGVGGDARGVGGVEIIAGEAVGEGCSGVAHASDGGPSGESCASDGDCRVDEESGSEVGGRGDRADEGGVVLRGKRKMFSTSPPLLSNSASHLLLTALLVRLAGGGEGFGKSGESSASWRSGSGCSGLVCLGSAVGEFARVGACMLGATEEGAMTHVSVVPAATWRQRRCWARGAAVGGSVV